MSSQDQINQLDPLSFPLKGSRLIEASAGTGKTFTIALLYLRLILGPSKQQENDFAQPLGPKDILVVTFTELAAGELRDRIRARLVQAGEYFRDPQLQDDALLVRLRDNYAQEQWEMLAWRLQIASESMDEASISTIHSWCNRMLVEHAFDTRGLFNRELVTDNQLLLREVVRDYWRVHFYQLADEQAAIIHRLFATPDTLESSLRALLQPSISGISFKGQPLQASLAQVHNQLELVAQQQRELEQLKSQAQQYWLANWQQIHDYLQQIRPTLNGTTHDSSNADKFNQLLAQIYLWASEGAEAPSKLANFASGAFKYKKNQQPQPPTEQVAKAFDLLLELQQLQQQEPMPEFRALLLAHAADWVKNNFNQRMQSNAQMSFDDLLLQLEQALCVERSGSHALQLAKTLKQSFPVALIDEFQDTDPVQYRIFEHIYQVSANDQDSGLFMIGDPKQSIYSFRGADIQTYLQVRRATSGRHYTLKTNFRSTAQTVAACNSFFRFAEQHPQGAFGYRDEQGDNQIPFVEVQAHGRSEQLWHNGQQVAPMTLWYLQGNGASDEEQVLSVTNYRQQAAAVAASQIAQWLCAGAQSQMGFGAQEVERQLRPADIAILVRDVKEAKHMSDALHQHGIASVYLSDRDSLLASQEAQDVLIWLRACAEPQNEQLTRAALGSLTLDLPLQQLLQWQQDELAWEQQTQQFHTWQHSWQRQGVLVMLQQLMEHFDLPARLLRQPNGERSLTNLLHLGEWLQQAAGQIDGEQALIRYLAEKLGDSEEQALLRLESDAERIKILTIHKSKGLEFPLVVLPFICSWKEINARQTQVNYVYQQQRYREVAGSSAFAQAWSLADADRLREDLRLLYVALTRASHALWLGVAPLKSGNSKKPQLHLSAMGYALNAGNAFTSAAEVLASTQKLVQNSNIICVTAPQPQAVMAPTDAQQQLEPARTLTRLEHLFDWWIASYSGLEFGAGQSSAHEPQNALEDRLQEISRQDLSPVVSQSSGELMHRFPKGARWGTFLHGLLEWAAACQPDGFASAVREDELRDLVIERRCKLRNIADLAQPLSQWLKQFLQQPWPITGFALTDLQPSKMVVELEFLLEIHRVDSRRLDQLISSHSLPSQDAPRARPSLLNGLFKGFIDMVAEHQGRYYIIDWKSNYLGDNDAAYSTEAMQQAIFTYRYDVQYMLYLLALHRHLRDRLPGYDYDQHMGGAVYCFLRGWQNQQTNGLYYDRPPKELIEQLDKLFSQGAKS